VPTDEDNSEAVAQAVLGWGWRRLGLLYIDDAYGNGFNNALQEQIFSQLAQRGISTLDFEVGSRCGHRESLMVITRL
jgi:ABC-type branched-subunit amino acid transport system substrate-binding protein